jgi:hypothetical protein
MKRIGNRFELAVDRWRRARRRLQFRQRWAKRFGEYECFGGPHDGKLVQCSEVLEWWGWVACPGSDGRYELADDCRLHFKVHAKSWSAR